jgi:biotin transport system substrate-specific component
MIYASMFGAATAAGSFIIIPVPPVPITLQTLFLALAAGLLGANLAALSQLIYLFLGIVGLPVFAGGKAGAGVLFGPTGGYLVGFVVGAYVIGKLMEIRKGAGFGWKAVSIGAGYLVIYCFGVVHLSLVGKLSFVKALSVGVLPFLIGDTLKVVVGAWIILKLRERITLKAYRYDKA